MFRAAYHPIDLSSVINPAFNFPETRNGSPVEGVVCVSAFVSIGAHFALDGGKVKTESFATG